MICPAAIQLKAEWFHRQGSTDCHSPLMWIEGMHSIKYWGNHMFFCNKNRDNWGKNLFPFLLISAHCRIPSNWVPMWRYCPVIHQSAGGKVIRELSFFTGRGASVCEPGSSIFSGPPPLRAQKIPVSPWAPLAYAKKIRSTSWNFLRVTEGGPEFFSKMGWTVRCYAKPNTGACCELCS